jgi:hypothetical protein
MLTAGPDHRVMNSLITVLETQRTTEAVEVFVSALGLEVFPRSAAS